MAGEEIIFGHHAVTALLRVAPERVLEIWVLRGRQDRRLAALRGLAGTLALPVHEAPRATLDRLCGGGGHQGVCARARAAVPRSVPDLDTLVERLGPALLLLVLDGVQDPHNLGACLRSADAAGAAAVVVPRSRGVPVTPVVRKVASGAAESVPVLAVSNLARTLEELGQAGVRVVGADRTGPETIFATDLRTPLALVLGGEARGLRRLTRERCHVLARIPMAGSVQSLNVSVAAAVCLFEAVRRRSRFD